MLPGVKGHTQTILDFAQKGFGECQAENAEANKFSLFSQNLLSGFLHFMQIFNIQKLTFCPTLVAGEQ